MVFKNNFTPGILIILFLCKFLTGYYWKVTALHIHLNPITLPETNNFNNSYPENDNPDFPFHILMNAEGIVTLARASITMLESKGFVSVSSSSLSKFTYLSERWSTQIEQIKNLPSPDSLSECL